MDYEQDYSKLTADDQQWFKGNGKLTASICEDNTTIAVENEHLVRTMNLDSLDNEDFE